MKGFEDIGDMNLADLGRSETESENDADYDDSEDYGDYEEEQEADLEEPAAMVTVGDLENGAVEEYGEKVTYVEEPTELPRPQGEHYYIEARITQKEMNAFMFGHSYRSPLIIIVTVIAVVWALAMVFTQSSSNTILLAIIIVAIVLIGLPFSTWNRGRSTMRHNPIYNDIFHYMFDEWGLHLKVSDQIVEVDWSKIGKFMFLKSVTAVYTGRANAFLVPTKYMGDQEKDLKAFFLSHKGGK